MNGTRPPKSCHAGRFCLQWANLRLDAASFAVPTFALTKHSDFFSFLIARSQIALEESISRNARKYLISDTDAISTCIWSQWLTGECSEELTEIAAKNKYNLYLLCAPDLPWQEEQHRYLPNDRSNFFEYCKNELNKRAIKYHVIQGQGSSRFELASTLINAL